MKYSFSPTKDSDRLEPLKKAARQLFTAPQDGMWEAFTQQAEHWEIISGNAAMGYLVVNHENVLLQFFTVPEFSSHSHGILKTFLRQRKISKAVAGTNNPGFLCTVMEHQESVRIHSLLFGLEHSLLPVDLPHPATISPEGIQAEGKDLEKLCAFCNDATGAPRGWLQRYYAELIERKELFYLQSADSVAGTYEVRNSDSDSRFADVGMVVGPRYRRQGVGAYLLSLATRHAMANGREPVCSCEADNIGSRKSIEKNGYRTRNAMLMIEF